MTQTLTKNQSRFFWFLAVSFFAGSSLWADTVTKTIRVSFEIEPVTVLKAASSMGVSAVRLGPLSPHSGPATESIEVSVITNSHQRYRVYHRLEGGVFSESGSEFPRSKVLFMTTPGNKGGTSEIPNFKEVPDGEVAIFTSKDEGGKDNFHVLYTVNNDEVFPAGLFSGSIHLDVRAE